MLLGYNTNGLAHHRLGDAIDLLAEEGYESVAITLDVEALDPYAHKTSLDNQLRDIRSKLDGHGLRRVVETGARYLLNPRKKHDPTLLDPDPGRRDLRIDFLCRAIEIARRLQADAVSLWSGTLPDSVDEDGAFQRLVTALQPVLAYAEKQHVILGFEPEPGMFIDTLERFQRLTEHVDHPLLRMTMDLGHVQCLEEGRVADHVRTWGSWIVNVHIEDMIRGVHEHLPFGQGTMDFRSIIEALRQVGYSGGLHVELSRDSHRAVEAVHQSHKFLDSLLRQASVLPAGSRRASDSDKPGV